MAGQSSVPVQRGVEAPVEETARPQAHTPTAAEMVPTARIGAELHTAWRVLSACVGVAVLAFGGILAWNDKSDGVAVAGAFALAATTLIFALMGVVPASVKVGDVDIKLRQAKEAGREEGAVAGLKAAAALKDQDPSELKDALKTALTTENHLVTPDPHLRMLRVPNMGGEGEKLATEIAERLTR